jgi:nicotinate-nucleotide pyrophosphorylase (carboxylating)
MFNYEQIYKEHFELFYKEDDLAKNFSYLCSLPDKSVQCSLKIKDDLILSGLPFLFESFNFLMKEKINYKSFLEYEGKSFTKTEGFEINFELPFNIALTGERIALNLVQRSSSISTFTNEFVEKAKGITILDTRKTTPGLRFLEKYAVKIGGGSNHRYSQIDSWMVKDNHKKIFGGVVEAVAFFRKQNVFYSNMIVEIHDLEELEKAMELGITNFLLDNFSVVMLKEAIKMKGKETSYEVSGGITLENLNDYTLGGVDAISSGSITYNAPHVDLSLKFG